MKIALCILTLNERPCLEVIFPSIPKPGAQTGYDELFAIDGNSSDGTVDYFTSQGIPVLQHSERGRGGAYRTAFSKIEADAYIFLSPDGNEAVEDLHHFRPLLEEGAHLVIASRMMKGGFNEEDIHLFKWRKWVSGIFNLMANLLFRKTGPYVTDSSNGLRAITRRASEIIMLDASEYTSEYQMTIRAMKHRLKIVEFPTVEGQRVAGETSARSIPTGLRFLSCLGHELFSG